MDKVGNGVEELPLVIVGELEPIEVGVDVTLPKSPIPPRKVIMLSATDSS